MLGARLLHIGIDPGGADAARQPQWRGAGGDRIWSVSRDGAGRCLPARLGFVRRSFRLRGRSPAQARCRLAPGLGRRPRGSEILAAGAHICTRFLFSEQVLRGRRMVDVTIVGAGPVGLWAAAELARRHIDVVVIEKLSCPSPHSKALTVHPRTLEVFGQRGIAQVAIDAGIQIPSGHFANLDRRMDFQVLDTPYPFTLLYSQEDTEILLESTARAAGADIRREHEVVAVADEGDVVVTRVRAADSTYLIESRYLIGADGARSFVRAAAGIEFEGTNTTHWGFLGD